ncbi:MAG: glycosyltransferase [Chloroflexi bacterium]|nr:glycosyltransferase [Chloroflexota bacterium]MBT7081905.1 glycosyltransferase [Chloroflexota bacterium]
MKLSVVIPALNEGLNIRELITSMHQEIPKITDDYEILIVDGGSKDNTRELAASLGARVVMQKEKGYGGALKTGFISAKGEYIVTLDADLSHSPTFIPLMWEAKSDAEIVIASRYAHGGSAEMPLSRRILSRILNMVFTRGLSLPVKDISSGFRLYHSSTLRELDLTSSDFDILEEVLVKCYAQGWKIKEVPFHYYPRKGGVTHAKLIQFAISYLKTFKRMWGLRNSIESADYDERAYNSVIPMQRWWQRKRFKIITKLAKDAGAILDIGCGSSKILGALDNVIGLDILMRKLRYGRKHGKPLFNASVFNLPFKDNTFDCVICSEVIEHVPADKSTFAEMTRVLKPGGRLILGTPDYGRWRWRFTEWVYEHVIPGGYAEEHITHYTQKSLTELMESLGYTSKENHYVFGSELIMLLEKAA